MKSIFGRSIVAAAGAALCLLVTGLPASAAPSAVSHPAITHFGASVTSLPASGGSVTLSTTVKYGTACVFTSSPALPGLPATLSCSHGSASRTVRLPANTAAGMKAYTFGLTVTGPGGKTTAKPVTVAVREAAPTITQVAVRPADLPSAGGATALSALVSRSATCTVSATPAVAGLPVTKPCAAGSTPVRILVPVTLPALSGTAATRYSLTLKVSGPGGTSTVSASGSVWPAMKFSGPATIDAPAGWLGTVSCTSSFFCMGIDEASGSAVRWNGTNWSAPVRIETGLYLDAGYDISLSCVSAAFCLAVDANGNSFSYDGTSWSSAVSIGLDATSVSCATPAFCMATAKGQEAVFNGSAWSAPVTISNADRIEAISCPDDSFCMAVSAAGLAYTFTTSHFCLIADLSGNVATFNGATWSATSHVDPVTTPGTGLTGASCADAAHCMAVDWEGNALTGTG